MLRNQGIRTKLLAVLSLPIVALVIVATVVSLQAFAQARKASQVEQLARGAGSLGALVSSLQDERSISTSFLAKRPVADQLKRARAVTDDALASTQAVIGSVDLASLSPEATAAVAEAGKGHAQLKALRASVDEGFAEPDQVAHQYSTIIGSDVALPQRIGDGLQDRAIGRQLTAFSTAQNLAELATQERETVLGIIDGGRTGATSAADLARLAALQNEGTIAFRRNASTSETTRLDTALFQPVKERAAFRTMESTLLGLGSGNKVDLSASQWRNATNSRIAALESIAAPVAEQAAVQAADAASSARNQALLVLAGGALLVLLLIGLGLVLSRTITRPLRRLTEAAAQVRDELPLMVERMATPGEGPGVELPEIPVTSRDEVGRLAEAFKDVNATTVRVAEQQAALRASIAEMFVNVARRNHVLLSRQLSFIDQLERTEENPDTLDNLFRLDHLATRMRRNAESLIVLAGIDAGRRLRRPMPLSDVIRTAVSEIERYDRVDLALQADPPLVGHVALTSAHMLAELLENATQFSNPDTRVIASTSFTPRGVRVTLTDLGLGMTWDEITDANQRIANPPVTDVVGSQRLGFYVVGRLARRLDARVELKPGRSQGTVVTIELPPALFVPGSVVEIPGVADDESRLPLEAGPTPQVHEATTEALEADVAPDAAPEIAAKADPGDGGSRVEPRVPVSPAPFPHQVSHDSGDPQDGGSNLPRRGGALTATSAPAVPAAPAAVLPAATSDLATAPGEPATPDAEPTAPRVGIFSGFRSRRTVEPPAVEVEDAGRAFVPTIETSTPALPQRGEPALPSRRSEPVADHAAAVEPEVLEPEIVEPELLEPEVVTIEVTDAPVTDEAVLAELVEDDEDATASALATAEETTDAQTTDEPVDALTYEVSDETTDEPAVEAVLEEVAEAADESHLDEAELVELAELVDEDEPTSAQVYQLTPRVPSPLDDDWVPEGREPSVFDRVGSDPVTGLRIVAPLSDLPEDPIEVEPAAEWGAEAEPAWALASDSDSDSGTDSGTDSDSDFGTDSASDSGTEWVAETEVVWTPEVVPDWAPLSDTTWTSEPVALLPEPVALLAETEADPASAPGWVADPTDADPAPVDHDTDSDADPDADPDADRVNEDGHDLPTAADAFLSPAPTGEQARSTLSELAREAGSADAAETYSEPEPASAPPVAPAAFLPPVGVPAMDILPKRSPGRGLRLRRPARNKPAPVSPAPIQPPVTLTPAAPRRPVGAPVERESVAVQPVPSPEADQPSVPAASAGEPIAAPPSLFAPLPLQGGAPAQESAPDVTSPAPAHGDLPAWASANTEPVIEPAVPALAAAQSLRERSAMASEALSELSALSSYRPEAHQPTPPSSLVRRTPQATEAGQLAAPPEEAQGARRGTRNAADVRSMLSGFRAGVERGRTSPGGQPPRDRDGA